jgi:hypothetical protein
MGKFQGEPKGSKSHPELLLLFHMGYSSKQLMYMGFKISSVYSYHKRYREIMKNLPGILSKLPKAKPSGGE